MPETIGLPETTGLHDALMEEIRDVEKRRENELTEKNRILAVQLGSPACGTCDIMGPDGCKLELLNSGETKVPRDGCGVVGDTAAVVIRDGHKPIAPGDTVFAIQRTARGFNGEIREMREKKDNSE